MKFYMPTKLYLERNCVVNHKKELAALGTKALLVTGRHSAKANGAYDDVAKSLKEENVPFCLFDEIEENPSVETVMRAAQFGREQQADFVIGIGGGSPMDAAKAIALMMKNPQEDEKVLYQKKELPAYPVAEVPTTAGTGSEVTPYAILTLHEQKTKRSMSHHIFPKLALADAHYLSFAGRELIVNTAVDTLAHLLESRLNKNTTPYSQLFSEEGLKLWGDVKESLMGGSFTEEVYEILMRTSTLGGMTISHTGTSIPHGMSYYLTYNQGIPHGRACGVFLGEFLELYGREDLAQTHDVIRLMGFQTIPEFKGYMSRLLGTVQAPKDCLDGYTDSLAANTTKLANYPFTITRDQIRQMFERSVEWI